jgi:hypothetical protein
MKQCNDCRFLGKISYRNGDLDSRMLFCANKKAKRWYNRLKIGNDPYNIINETMSCNYFKSETLKNQKKQELRKYAKPSKKEFINLVDCYGEAIKRSISDKIR